jgi:hypothetical protein
VTKVILSLTLGDMGPNMMKTLPVINKTKSTQKKGEREYTEQNKMEGRMSTKMTKEPPKRANQKNGH